MDLHEISDLILKQVKHNQECGKDDKFTLDEIQGIITRRVVNILEPENVYQKGQYYDGFGVYIGIVDTYPWGEDYFRREHRFSVEPESGVLGKTCEIKSILIREIKR
jgi:hypothetical protein